MAETRCFAEARPYIILLCGIYMYKLYIIVLYCKSVIHAPMLEISIWLSHNVRNTVIYTHQVNW